MPSLKDVQTKIGAVKKTRQITKAMNMVATSRLRGNQTLMDGFRPYADKFKEVLGNLAGNSGEESGVSLLVPRDEIRRIHIVLCTSDRGLCGGFNVNLTKKAEDFITQQKSGSVEFSFTCFGKKGSEWCKKISVPVTEKYIGVVGGRIPFNVASTTGRKLVSGYLNDLYDQVHVVYANFINMGKQIPLISQLLPIPPISAAPDQQESDSYNAEHICEPSSDELLNDLLPRNVFVQLYNALLETSTSEHAARMTAMDNATKACNDMLENLTLAYNKARQAAITAELMDIVGGAEALKG